MKKKKQHYVPRFYLKYFSINGLEKQIGIYNKISENFIPNGGLKNQAYENYFYGEDGAAEDQLSLIEQEASKYLSQLISERKVPPRNSISFKYIKEYTFLQESRTKASADLLNEMVNRSVNQIMKHDEPVKKYADEYVFEWKNAPLQSIQTLFQALHITTDLEFKILINKTKMPFVTSDNPVAQYNQFLEKRNHYGGKAGLAAKGLQVIFPVNPGIAIIYYDSNVYKLGGRKQNEVIVEDVEDVKSINLLQFLNCDENVYFNEDFKTEDAKEISGKAKKFEKTEKLKIKEYPERENPDGTFSILTHTFTEGIGCNLNLSFFKELKKTKSYKLTGYAVELRKEEWRYNGFLKK